MAGRAEALGFDTLLLPDHVGSDWAPLMNLAAAASTTERLRFGTFVLNACFYNPVMLARDVATLDQITNGRFELGLGAGHTPAEFAATGNAHDAAERRKARLGSFTAIVRRLLDGERVDHDDEFYRLAGASIRSGDGIDDGARAPIGPTAQERLPILVGGNGQPLLSDAARQADIIGLTGTGRVLDDGHHLTVHWQAARLDEQIALVKDAAGPRYPGELELNALVQRVTVTVTDDRERAARELVDDVEGLDLDDALATPFLALGTVDEIAAQLVAARERWGLSYFVVRDADAFAPVIAALR